jgi:GT2 family glycosyltransferase
MSIQISASIVLYNSGVSVKEAICSYLDTPNVQKLYLVDNSPTNILFTSLSDILTDNRVEYIFNNANLGFGAGHNIAIKKALHQYDYHLVLNPDVCFGVEVLPTLANYMEANNAVGLVMPKVVYPNGEIQYVAKLLPSPVDLIFKRFIPSFLIKKRMERFQLKFTGYDKEMEVPYLSGCFMFLRTSALQQVGLFDERFFMYPEDIDLTRRMHQKFSTRYWPGTYIVHKHEQGSYKNKKLLFIHISNMIRYFNKWGWLFDAERRKVNRDIMNQFKN